MNFTDRFSITNAERGLSKYGTTAAVVVIQFR